jgi:hypothetical protein
VFSDAVGSGLLTLQGVGVVGSDETESSVFLNPIENGGLLASNFFFKKQEVLDEKLFKLKFLRLRGMTDLYLQKDSGATSFKTKLAKIFSPLVKQVNFFKKVSINAVSWVTYFIDYFKGTEVESKLRDELDTSAELFKKFFINTTFYKKVQWKTIFKYYYWTWDPLWMRYRYRIYWRKKAVYKKIDKFIFYYFYKRLRALQRRRLEVMSGWHNVRSERYLSAQREGGLNSKFYRDKWVSRFFFSKTFWNLSDRLIDGLLSVHVLCNSVQKSTFMSLRLSLTLRRVIFLSIDAPFYVNRYLGFLPQGGAKVKSNNVGRARWFDFLKKKINTNKPRGGVFNSVKRWKKKLWRVSKLDHYLFCNVLVTGRSDTSR